MSLKEQCLNMTQATKFISNILKTLPIEENIDNMIIKELVQHHPTKRINISNVEWFKIKIRPPYNKPALHYKYKKSDNIDDISWKLCIRNLYGKYNRDKEYENDVKAAFRNESHMGTKKQYFIDNTTLKNDCFVGQCVHCKKKTGKISTDHYELPYKKILDRYIEKKNIDLRTVDIFENEDNEIRIKDETLASDWLKFHDSNAKYRMLCISCNSHFGSYGYK